MPKVGRLTPHEKRCRKLMRYISAECRGHDCKSLAGLARELGVNYNTLYSALREGTISALRMNDIIHVLGPEAGARIHRI